MPAFYNENDPKAAAWLRELIAQGEIAPGVVDERSIEDIHPDELRQYEQCHFFAGIGGWSLALRLVGIPDHARVWTGSCPCQPFSAAGKGLGVADERHLWPAFFHLIEIERPPIVFGEQVASKDGLGWADLVRTDLEGTGYSVGLSDLCSAGVKAADIRQRLYWMAVSDGWHAGTQREQRSGEQRLIAQDGSACDGLAHHHQPGPQGRSGPQRGEHDAHGQTTARVADGGVEHPARVGRVQWWPEPSERGAIGGRGEVWADALDGPWRDADWLFGRDGFWRPVEAGTFPLAHGVPERVGLLRGYGNAINPHVAAAFIETGLAAIAEVG